jgi:hypothetical protein
VSKVGQRIANYPITESTERETLLFDPDEGIANRD